MAEVKSEAVGVETHSLLREEVAPKDGAEAVLDNSLEASPESKQEETQNTEPEKEPLTNSATEEQAEKPADSEESGSPCTPVPECASPPEAQEQMPVLLGTEGDQADKKAVEKTDAPEKTVEDAPSQAVEDSTKKKEAEKTAKAGSKDKKKAGDKEHSKTKSKQTGDSKSAKKSEGGKSEGSSAKKSSGPDDFKVLEGKDAFVGKDADAMKAVDIEECKEKCRSGGYGAFIVWEGVACFRTQSGEECLNNLVDAPKATLYVYIPDGGKKEESQASPATQDEAKGDAPEKEASKASVGKPKSAGRKKSTPKTEEKKMEKTPTEVADSNAPVTTMAEAPKVDDAAKKRERKEAWKAMSDAEKKEKGSALLAAAKAGKAAEVKKLLEENVSQDYVDGDGWSGLHFAANEGKLDVAIVLLQYDADPTLTIKLGEWGQTPLHYAARQGNREIAEKLVAADKKGKALRTKHWKGKVPHEMASGDLAKYLKKMAKQGS